ncbi:MAG: hypothetical protein II433_01980 [Acidaminococcaceae bacterium]|nr:hypothetical protein [Acidaminococcaceae bacterium]
MKTERAQKDAPAAERNRQRIDRLERLRRVLLVLGTLILLGGYVSSLLPVMYASALPLLGVALVTYRIKYLEESGNQ